ncbi:MAG: helix-turn-helix transcriptional regulator [Patescibacteria group bacterium]|nr:helix-turn-helix transcriptional regulator [Patescibacteria group bacterium]
MNKKTKLNKQFDKQFGAFVKKKRLEKGLSQKDLASAINNDFQNISRLERGNVTPTIFWCYRLADAFEMDMQDFIKEFGFILKK